MRRWGLARLARGVAAFAGWAVASAPAVVLACPACLGADQKNAAFLKLGSLFVLVPFVVVGLVMFVLRQAPDRR